MPPHLLLDPLENNPHLQWAQLGGVGRRERPMQLAQHPLLVRPKGLRPPSDDIFDFPRGLSYIHDDFVDIICRLLYIAPFSIK